MVVRVNIDAPVVGGHPTFISALSARSAHMPHSGIGETKPRSGKLGTGHRAPSIVSTYYIAQKSDESHFT